jgi:superfamily I DNA and/or RNA helicase
MLDSASLFDWSIVEEAGRATGMDLLAPLMLSHRRLLIGDSKQLPPFGEDKIQMLFQDPRRLSEALQIGKDLVRSAHHLELEDLLERYANVENVRRVAHEVEQTLLLFSHLHGHGFEQQTTLPMAGRLEEQHRMHPDIAALVSDVFYKGVLRTSDQARAARRPAQQPFSVDSGKPFLEAPIVLIDMPWSQKSATGKFGERVPAYHNPEEVGAVVEVLSSLRPRHGNGPRPSLAILTPYNEQAKRLRRRISEERQSRLTHLDDFSYGETPVHTIDSFQGNEADVVVVSLVRNNGRGWFKGLGILGDSRRMNVLLSRAKWKLIIVGSLRFLKQRFPPLRPITQGHELHFLKRLNRAFAATRGRAERRRVSVIAYSDL